MFGDKYNVCSKEKGGPKYFCSKEKMGIQNILVRRWWWYGVDGGLEKDSLPFTFKSEHYAKSSHGVTWPNLSVKSSKISS